MIDTSQLQALAQGAPELVLEILEDFRTEALEYLDELESFLTDSQFGEGAGILHKLAGSSGTLGLFRFCEKVCEMEAECKQELVSQGSTDELRRLLETSVEQAREFLRNGSFC